jgi:hypothetical protein
MSQQQDFDERLKQREKQLEQKQEKEEEARNLQADRQQVQNRQYSRSFYEKIADSDLNDSLSIPGIEDEHPAVFSNAHISGQRDRHYVRQQEFLNRAKAEQFVLERSPGRLLERNPGIHAVMRGDEVELTGGVPLSGTVSDAGAEVPSRLDTAERRAHRLALREVATTQQSLAVGGVALKQLTTATSETHTVKHDSEDDGLISSVTGRVFG